MIWLQASFSSTKQRGRQIENRGNHKSILTIKEGVTGLRSENEKAPYLGKGQGHDIPL